MSSLLAEMMKLPFICLALLLAMKPISGLKTIKPISCLKSWDVVLALTEQKLNVALDKVVAKYIRNSVLSTLQMTGQETDIPGLGKLKRLYKLEGLKIDKLHLSVMPSREHVGKLAVTFSGGSLNIIMSYEMAGYQIPPTKEEHSLQGKTLDFRVRVTAYKLALQNNGGSKYSIRLEIVEEDALMGNLAWNINFEEHDIVRKALSAKIKNELSLGERFDLGSFDIPRRNPRQTSLVKDIFPKIIRFAFVHNKRSQGESALVALTTSATTEGRFQWAIDEVLPHGRAASITISGTSLMRSLRPVISKHLGIPMSNLNVRFSCPSEMRLNSRINDFKKTTDLKNFILQIHGSNELQIKIDLFDHVSPGITVDIEIEVRLGLSYNNARKEFDIRRTFKGHSTEYDRDWWVILLEVVTLGIGRIVTLIIELISNIHIADAIRGHLNFHPGNGGLPTNVGGVLGEVVDNMHIQDVRFYRNNLVFSFELAL